MKLEQLMKRGFTKLPDGRMYKIMEDELIVIYNPLGDGNYVEAKPITIKSIRRDDVKSK